MSTTDQRRGSAGAVALAAILLLLVLYVLSPGPTIWLCAATGYESAHWLEIVFAPLVWLYNKSAIVHRLYDWYFALFGIR